MLELADDLLAMIDGGRRVAVATVVVVDGSAPRGLGTSMAVDDQGIVIGSISGGCVEGAVYEVCARVLETGTPERCAFGLPDDGVFDVGLACGGNIEVVVQELAPSGRRNALAPGLRRELEAARSGEPAAVVITIEGPHPAIVTSSTEDIPRELEREIQAARRSGLTGPRLVDCDGVQTACVILATSTPPRLLIFGAVDFAAALVDAGILLGYAPTVCDARPVFASANRFPRAEVVVRWPSDYLAETVVDERTVICVMTHDDKFDVPLLELALRLPVAYVGAMGSRRTDERRRARLLDAGVCDFELAALHSPIGLDLGAVTPQEAAVSIMAEVLQSRSGASGAPLRETGGPIHERVPAHS